MNKATGLALLAAGIALIAFGISDSMTTDFWEFANTPTNATLWLLFFGAIEVIAGTVMTVRSFDREEK